MKAVYFSSVFHIWLKYKTHLGCRHPAGRLLLTLRNNNIRFVCLYCSHVCRRAPFHPQSSLLFTSWKLDPIVPLLQTGYVFRQKGEMEPLRQEVRASSQRLWVGIRRFVRCKFSFTRLHDLPWSTMLKWRFLFWPYVRVAIAFLRAITSVAPCNYILPIAFITVMNFYWTSAPLSC